MSKETGVEVVTDLPPPSHKGLPGRPPKYDWESIGVGHSMVVVPADGVPTLVSVRSYASQKGRELGRRFSVAEMADGRIQVYRRS